MVSVRTTCSNIQNLCILSTQCIYVFHIILKQTANISLYPNIVGTFVYLVKRLLADSYGRFEAIRIHLNDI